MSVSTSPAATLCAVPHTEGIAVELTSPRACRGIIFEPAVLYFGNVVVCVCVDLILGPTL
jgi:hypothetical protein